MNSRTLLIFLLQIRTLASSNSHTSLLMFVAK